MFSEDFTATNLKSNMLHQLKFLGIETQVKHDFRVVHVVGELSWRREVTVRHHLLGAVDDHRLVDVGFSRLWRFLESEVKHSKVLKLPANV